MSEQPKVVIADYYYDSLAREKAVLAPHGFIVEDYHCVTEDDLIAVAKDADALTAAFTEYSQKRVKQQSKPSILAQLSKFKELVKGTISKERHHDKGERTL